MKELSTLSEMKTEEIQRQRAKDRSFTNWTKVKETVQKKYTMFFKLNR